MVKHFKIRIAGRVQGVFYRQSTLEEATKLGLKGTVQNLPDGSVEIHAEGDEKKLEELILWCKEGPQHADVNNVEIQELKLANYKHFRII
jgi:acylphosphatase